MDKRSELLARVREAAENIAQLKQGLNFPIREYLDEIDLNALCDAFSLDPEQWSGEDLEKILLLRDGLYQLRHDLRDKGSDPSAEHSVDLVLAGMDRLYADLERALRELGKQELTEAQGHLSRLREGPRVSATSIQRSVQDLRVVATEVLTQAQITQRTIEINIFRIDRLDVNLEVLKNAKLNVKRLSASVFAIKLSLEQNVIFQGIFRFLSEGADRVLADLTNLARQLQKTYAQAKDFLAELSKLSETGGRFARLMGDFLTQVFGDRPPTERAVDLRQQTSLQSEAMLCGTMLDEKLVILGGRRGNRLLLDTSTMRVIDQVRSGENINGIAIFAERMAAIGRNDGLDLVPAIGKSTVQHIASYREYVTSVECMNWGALSEGEIVTGSRDGTLRRWVQVANLSQEKNVKIGRQIQKLMAFGDELLVASKEELLVVDEDLDVTRRIHLNFAITDFDIIDDDTLVVCGPGNVAHVNLAQGIYTRLIAAGNNVEYTAVTGFADGRICAGTEDGKVVAMDFHSGHELGMVGLGFHVRGLIPLQRRLLVYGGAWNGVGKSIAFVTWQERELQAQPV